MIRANNMWEAHALRKLTTIDAVQEQLTRCNSGLISAQTNAPFSKAAILGWNRKIKFLVALLEELMKK